jgi:hypothetical protein
VSDRAPLDAADWTRVSAIFHRALAAPAAERMAVVAEACGGDPRLGDEVASLLQAHDQTAGWLDAAADAASPANAAAPVATIRRSAPPSRPAIASVPTASTASSARAGWASSISPRTRGSGDASR